MYVYIFKEENDIVVWFVCSRVKFYLYIEFVIELLVDIGWFLNGIDWFIILCVYIFLDCIFEFYSIYMLLWWYLILKL